MNQELRIKNRKESLKSIIHDLLFMIRKSEGFTLIELLVVIAIVGILAGFLMANFIGVRERARDGQRKSDLRQIQAALELYRSDHGSYPSRNSIAILSALPLAYSTHLFCGVQLTDGGTPPVVYMQKVPCDPSDTTTGYSYGAEESTPSLWYRLFVCLENKNDNQRDDVDGGPEDHCSSPERVSWLLGKREP